MNHVRTAIVLGVAVGLVLLFVIVANGRGPRCQEDEAEALYPVDGRGQLDYPGGQMACVPVDELAR